jgi:lysyl-tRNA synthetase class 2
MLYSLARFRHSRPLPPFQLGGEFLRLKERCFLRDAAGAVVLLGPSETWSHVHNGDQVVAMVERVSDEGVYVASTVGSVSVVVAREGEWPRPPRPHAVEFARFVEAIRRFFLSQGLREIFTPTLVPCPGLEPTLEPFSLETTYISGKGTAYLPTSPEIHLKKALAMGWTDIFEVKPCFRRGEFSPHHQPEFTMLEWYRGFADLEPILADIQELWKSLRAQGFIETEAAPQVTTFRALFEEMFGFSLTPTTPAAELRALAGHLQLHTTADDSFADLFHRLMIEHIEPRLKEKGPTIVRDFPPSMAALARLSSLGWADRFELYWNGLEIANAFNEVNDPREQERRWQAEREERRRLGTSDVPEDPELIRALESGMPPSGGVALGVERLYMACRGIDDIRELKLFSAER